MTTDKFHAPKLLLDEHIWMHLAKLLREQGFDVVHAVEVGLANTDDHVILQVAVQEHRAVVTFNTKDYEPLLIRYFEEGKEHYGIIVSDEVSKGELQRRVTKLLRGLSAKEIKNTIQYLQDFK